MHQKSSLASFINEYFSFKFSALKFFFLRDFSALAMQPNPSDVGALSMAMPSSRPSAKRKIY